MKPFPPHPAQHITFIAIVAYSCGDRHSIYTARKTIQLEDGDDGDARLSKIRESVQRCVSLVKSYYPRAEIFAINWYILG